MADDTKTTFAQSPDAERIKVKQGKQDQVTDRPDATANEPVTNEVADQTPMEKPLTDAPAFAGPKNDEMPTQIEQAAPTDSEHPIADNVEVDGPAPVLGAPIGVNPTVPQAAHVEADTFNARLGEIGDPMAGAEHDGLTPMQHPEGGSSDAFDRRDDGAVLVPDDQVAVMIEHGFEVVPDTDPKLDENEGEDDMRFTAPPHTSDVAVSSGTYPVQGGVIDTPDDLPPGDLSGIAAAGFVPVPVTPADKVAELVDSHTKAELLDKAADLDVKPSDPKPVIAEAIVNAGIVPLVAGSTAPTGPAPVAGTPAANVTATEQPEHLTDAPGA